MFLTGNPDCDRLILLEVKSNQYLYNLKNSCKYGQKLCNEDFFRMRLRKKYPLLEIYKTDIYQDSFSMYYLDISKALYFLETKYNFPYIPNVSFEPFLFLDRCSIYKDYRTKHIWNDGLYLSVQIGDLNLIRYMIDKGARNFLNASNYVSDCKHNYKKVIDLLLKNAESILKESFHRLIYLNNILEFAARNCNLALVKYAVELGAESIESAIIYARYAQIDYPLHKDVIDYLFRLLN